MCRWGVGLRDVVGCRVACGVGCGGEWRGSKSLAEMQV